LMWVALTGLALAGGLLLIILFWYLLRKSCSSPQTYKVGFHDDTAAGPSAAEEPPAPDVEAADESQVAQVARNGRKKKGKEKRRAADSLAVTNRKQRDVELSHASLLHQRGHGGTIAWSYDR